MFKYVWEIFIVNRGENRIEGIFDLVVFSFFENGCEDSKI